LGFLIHFLCPILLHSSQTPSLSPGTLSMWTFAWAYQAALFYLPLCMVLKRKDQVFCEVCVPSQWAAQNQAPIDALE
jgi:hypothetical protein